MKIPTIKHLTEEAFKSAKRFPLTLISAFTGVIIAIYLTEYQDDIDNKFPFINLMLTSALGLVLFLCISIYHEKRQRTTLSFWILNIVGGLILMLIYFSLPNADDTTNIRQPYIKYAIYNVVVHLMVSFAPFMSKGEINGFWQYNKMLFLRFCLSIFYSGFIYLGITFALFALNLLFDVDIKDETFLELFIFVIGIFNTWFFISGINPELNSFEKNTDYPKGLKIFIQNVLLPLLILYFIILYAYVAKIIGFWDWPTGIVSYLIVCVAVLGILTFLLIYPFEKNKEKNWISKFSKIYYYLLLPLTVVLFIAIGIRIEDYGLTVNRYIIIELGVWLVFISGYFIFSKKNIKIIPMSLAVLILITSFGTWGMFSMSEKSQVKRLKNILIKNEILIKGKVINEPLLSLKNDTLYYLQNENKNNLLLYDSLQHEVYSILNYLDTFHGFNAIDNWYTQNPDSVWKALKNNFPNHPHYYFNEARIRMELMGLEYKYNYTIDPEYNKQKFYFTDEDKWKIIKIPDYDYVLNINYEKNSKKQFNELYSYENDSFYFSKSDDHTFTLIKEAFDTLSFDIGKLIKELETKYPEKSSISLEKKEMILYDTSTSISARLQIKYLTIERPESLKAITGELYVKLH